MAIKNKTRYAILGVLSMKPSSGYDIKKFCDKSISHFWNENFGHIYPVLKQLLDDGLIMQENKEIQDRRKSYYITDSGKDEFLAWLIEPPELQPHRSELLLKLSFGNYAGKDNVIQMMYEVKKRNEEKLSYFLLLEQSYKDNAAAKNDSNYPYFLAPLRFGILSAETAIRWCDETIQSIQEYDDGGIYG